MALQYGLLKCKVVGDPRLKATRRRDETQYHVHATVQVASSGGTEHWDTAINVGTDDSDDLLKYRLIFDFHHALRSTLAASDLGFHDLTGTSALPALDFLRSDVLTETGRWRDSDVMDGSESPEPAATLMRLLRQAKASQADTYIFGRTFTSGDLGIHDIHMNQGSSGSFLNNGRDDHNDHNAIWQDGAVVIALGNDRWTGYFTAFTQQAVPTDDLGNPAQGGHGIQDSDPGSLAGP